MIAARVPKSWKTAIPLPSTKPPPPEERSRPQVV